MNHFTKSLLSVALIALTILIVNCKGDQGDPGPQAANGANGADGKNGADGVGFSDAISRGDIIVYLDGKRPDGVAFKDTLDFTFSTSDLDYSSISKNYKAPSDSDDYSMMRRYLGYNGAYSDETNYVESDVEVAYGPGGPAKDTSKIVNIYLKADITFAKENKYFTIAQWFEFGRVHDFTTGSGPTTLGTATNGTLTAYKYDSVAATLKYKASFVSLAANNQTGYDLKVTVVANVSAYQTLPADRFYGYFNAPAERIAASEKTSRVVAKAEMKSIK